MPRERIPNKTGLTIRVPGKVVFLVPWPDHWLIGTTDAPFEGPPEHPSAAGWEVDRLLDTVNATMDVDLTRDDVVGTYAGLRPLIAPSDGSTVKASREHRVTVESNGVVRIGGGKYTTYRVMARDVIDTVLGPAEAKKRRSETAERRLIGAADPDALARIAGELSTIPAIRDVGPETAARLVARHGTEATALVALGAELDLLRPLIPGRVFLEAEVAWAARHELAFSLDDVLARRTRVAQELPDRGAAIAPRVAQILGAELGWGDARQRFEVETYLATARREYSVPPLGRPGRRPTECRPRWTEGSRPDVIGSSPHRAHHQAMESLADLQRRFFDGLYTNRIAVAVGSIVVAVVVFVIAWRMGWFAAARRHPGDRACSSL